MFGFRRKKLAVFSIGNFDFFPINNVVQRYDDDLSEKILNVILEKNSERVYKIIETSSLAGSQWVTLETEHMTFFLFGLLD